MSADNPTCREDVLALAQQLGVPPKALRVLSSHHDPFLCGADGQREAAEWFERMHGKYRPEGAVHFRRLHYVMVSARTPPKLPDGTTYRNTYKHFEALMLAGKFARHLGLVEPESFVDRRNPDAILNADYDLPDDHCDEPCWSADELPDWTLPQAAINQPCWWLPDVQADGYDYSLRDQPYHLEIWIEKSTMNDVLAPICQEHGVNLITGVGFQSVSNVVHMLCRLHDLPDDRPTRIGYISDFDPAGECMPVAVARQIEFYIRKYAPGRDVKLTPVALGREQVIEYDLPRIPIKESDKRKESFEDRRGEGAVELDALEALVPGELRRMVEQFIAPYRDDDLEGRLSEARDEAQAEVESAWQVATADMRRKLEQAQEETAAVVGRYQREIEELNRRMAADLQPVRAKLDAIRHCNQRLR